jgi:hypothetical protein
MAKDKEIRKEKDWLGQEKEVIYEDGKKTGEIREETTWTGTKVKREYDTEGKRVSEIRREKDWLGNDIDRTYNNDGKRISETRHETDWLGNPVDRIYDNDGKLIAETSRGTTLWGAAIKKVHGKRSLGRDKSNVGRTYYGSSGGTSSSGIGWLVGIGFILGIVYLLSDQLPHASYQQSGPTPPTSTEQASQQTAEPDVIANPASDGETTEKTVGAGQSSSPTIQQDQPNEATGTNFDSSEDDGKITLPPDRPTLPSTPTIAFWASHKHTFGKCDGQVQLDGDVFRYLGHPHTIILRRNQIQRIDSDGIVDFLGKKWHFRFEGKTEGEVRDILSVWFNRDLGSMDR